MVSRHRGHNRGVGPFLSSFSGGQKSFWTYKSSARSTGISSLSLFNQNVGLRAPWQNGFIQRGARGSEHFQGDSTSNQRQYTKRYIQHEALKADAMPPLKS